MYIANKTTAKFWKKGALKADWEIDFYSRPILEKDGKKRWELLISSSEDQEGGDIFRWEKICSTTKRY